ncbi:ABC transporter permease [Clostridium thermosuccinogenes]|jgi:ABC-type glycerol-3-phosphate transport system permease component|uniref:ABC transporter permease n=1 Tax=Clostridium thermosuccinogenes TaxID=84032 RepID=A0A2K2F3W1_9CLOT|nr:carbohydrate ABC transporter permease [Pseudoclostridium thermosuccinogenes]AUS95806.1 ABC transporter permease [Pseudoclostridium thermosuccinogenes]PNT93475.1 ABC transporter permease [Pseudoclostridium thermosuccinogenes]PNT95758.1 ABC transporter permease [Pseudoclostridium thermosuccinogenes]PNT97042.1 ABC transporter permease [Pseudoclostridium thermosuccinogenes]
MAITKLNQPSIGIQRQKIKVKRRPQNAFIRFFTDKKSTRSVGGNIVLVISLALLAFLFLFPVIFMFSNAFKPLNELLKFPPDLIVKNPTLDNFFDLGAIYSNSLVPLSRYIFNTIFIVFVGTAGQILFSSMAAYPLAKYEFFGSEFISKLIVLALMFSTAVTAVPNYIIISKLGLIDTYWAIILPACSSTLGLYLMKNFMEQIPSSLIESASLDGANEFITLWVVIMPSVKPAWITLFIISFQSMWGVTGGTYIYSEELKTLSYALGQIASSGIARQGVMAAVSIIMFLIPTVIFIFMQSNVMQTMTTSGMKD